MPEPFRLTADRFRDVPVLRLSGEVTSGYSLRELHDRVRDAVDSGHRQVVVDLSRIDSIDSSGIGALLVAQRIIAEAEGTMFLLRPPNRVRTSLALFRVTSMFEVVDDEADLGRRL
jgi:anti-sigma B factor antagonist